MNSNNIEIILVEDEQKNIEIAPYPIDFSKVCRTCMNSNTIVIPILESVLQNGTTLVDVLYECASVQVHSSDSLPLNICNDCLNEVLRIHIFKEQCYNTEQSLKKLLASSPTFEENEICNNEVYDNVQSPLNIEEELPQANRKKRNRKKLLASSPTFEENETCNDEVSDSVQSVLNIEEESPQTNRKKRHQSKPVSKKKLLENFKDEDASLEHQNKPKNVNPSDFECEICHKKFRIMFKLQEHMRSHTKEKPYVCELCGLMFSLSGNLQRHMKIHTGDRPHVCDICGKGFIQRGSLRDHLKTHTNMSPPHQLHKEPNLDIIFKCEYCERPFTRKIPFLKHLESHTVNANEKTDDPEQLIENKTIKEDVVQAKKSDKYYFCEICDRLCKSELLLKSHLLTHERNKSFLCSECGKSFRTKAALKTHLQVHTGVKLYTCKVCFKSYTSYNNLKTHTLIHMGVKSYRCELCPKAFTQSGHLRYHLRTHNGERPYVCDYCDKSFSLKMNLTVHVRTHTGETPYVCNVCGKGFYHSSSMKKHKKIHKGGKTIISKNILNYDILQNYEETNNFSNSNEMFEIEIPTISIAEFNDENVDNTIEITNEGINDM